MATGTQAALRGIIKKLVDVLANLPNTDEGWFATKVYVLQCSDRLKTLYEFLDKQYKD